MSGLKEPTRKIVSILNTSFEPQIPSLNGSPEKKLKQKYCDVRSIELQDLENCDKVIDEVRKRLNMDHIKITSNKSKESHHEISIKNSQLQNFKQFNLKEEYQKKQLRLKKQLMVKENTFITSNQSSKANSLQQSKVDLEISRYLKEKAKIKKMQINYKNHILQSQRETTQARQRLRSNPKAQPLLIEDKFETPSFLTSLPRNPILLKEKSEASQEQQVEENIYNNLQNYFFLREQQPLLRRQRISCRQCTSHTKRYSFIINKLSDNHCKQKELNKMRQVCLMHLENQCILNQLPINNLMIKPITSNIRQRSCSLEQSKRKVQRLRTQAEKMRQTYLQKNNEQREWYQQLIWECPKNIGDPGDYILQKLKGILEEGFFIKSEDIIDLINEIHSNEFYKFSFCFIKLILQILEYFEIDREYLTNFIKFKVLLSNYQD